MLSNTTTTTRTIYMPDTKDCGNNGAGITLTIDESSLLRNGKDMDRPDHLFFDNRSKREIRAVMASNRAPFLSL